MKTSARALDQWMQRRSSRWLEQVRYIEALRRRRRLPLDTALTTARQYLEIARDLAVARQLSASARTQGYLSGLYAELHRLIHTRPAQPRADLRRYLREELPAAVHALRWHVAAVAALFLLAALAGWLLVRHYPELVALVASGRMIDKVQHGQLWTDDLLNIVPSSVLAPRIFTNNIVVALFACCIGAFYGIGTLYLIGMNGFMLGAVFAFTAQHGMAGRLFEFIIAHGLVELSVICLAGAVGLSLGESLVRPGLRSRREAFESSAARALKLMGVGVVFLIGAGLIEGYISPNNAFPLAARVIVGATYLMLFLVVVTGAWRRRAVSSAA